MKSLLPLLLLGVCLVCLVSSNRHSDESRDSDEEPEYDESRRCEVTLQTCVLPFREDYQLLESDPSEGFSQIRQKGPRALCRDALSFGGCVKEKLTQPVCRRSLRRFVSSSLKKMWDITQKLCVAKLDDFDKHWNCLFTITSPTEVEHCETLVTPLNDCDADKLAECVANVFAAKSECQAGADQFIKQVLPDLFDLFQTCPSHKSGSRIVRRALENWLNF